MNSLVCLNNTEYCTQIRTPQNESSRSDKKHTKNLKRKTLTDCCLLLQNYKNFAGASVGCRGRAGGGVEAES